uniref:Uncharacterized protein n=1 Tax=Panagrolaimus sp. PS1159 TaxID=55785 RepID=A0AC35GSS6_9BILA
MKILHFYFALIFSALAVNAFVYHQPPINEGSDTSIGQPRERRQSDRGWDRNNNGRKKRESEFNEGLDARIEQPKEHKESKINIENVVEFVLENFKGITTDYQKEHEFETMGEKATPSSSLTTPNDDLTQLEAELTDQTEEDKDDEIDALEHKSLIGKKCRKGFSKELGRGIKETAKEKAAEEALRLLEEDPIYAEES